MSIRSEVADVIRAHQPTWDVHNTGLDLTGPTKTTVMVEQTKVEPSTDAAGLRNVSLTVTVVVPGENLATVEDKLEDALDDLLEVLDLIPHVGVSADRGVVNGSSLNAYAVTVVVPARKKE